ncbi:hypothetical protein [Diaphorobacter aerolatus]|uniref:Uncharacterized protein n=1 Tax=Diaphorobacter aerolatus TaxID=1288495 RepID=A0A7H0GLF6_9BURK|nr:hypothetical protein [Diaphorobacter aerolatus]QNP49122.1 hypothetical protein H9K75_02965 [Diaphorobacter aerolatus]
MMIAGLPMFAFASSTVCNQADAQYAEEKLSSIENWHDYSIFYKEYNACDTSALSYAYIQTEARLLSTPGGVKAFLKEANKDIFLGNSVVRKAGSDTITAIDSKKILSNLSKECMSLQDKRFCIMLKKKLTSRR